MIILWGFYSLTILLCITGGEIGRRIVYGERVNMPLKPFLLDLSTGWSLVFGLILFGYGFFIFSWYVVLITFFGIIYLSVYFTSKIIRKHSAPLIAILTALGGIFLGLMFVFARLAS
jgi:hypothetical protein